MRDGKAGASVAAWLAVLLFGMEAAAADGVLTNADVLRLTKTGVGEAAIVAMIDSSATDFDTGVDAVVMLAEAGVGDSVIAAKVKARGGTAVPAPGSLRGAERSGIPVAPGSVFHDRLSGGGEGPRWW